MFRSTFFNFARRQIQSNSRRHIHDVSAQIVEPSFPTLSNLNRYNLDNVSTQFIKPSLPTPLSLHRYNLNSMDRFSRIVYMPFIFHFLGDGYKDRSSRVKDVAEKSQRLKSSLSETLAQYYPFAGRLSSNGCYVECNDAGVQFQEVHFECGLSEILKKPEYEVRDFFYPKEFHISDKKSCLVVVRVHHFECGGMSIMIGVSHKLGDAGSLLTFLNSWAIKTRNASSDYAPHFLENPPTDIEIAEYPITENDKRQIRKIVFPNSKIAELKSTVSGSTRVEALTALLFKASVKANNVNIGSFTPHFLMTMVNMRHKMLEPIPDTSIGNLYWPTYVFLRNESDFNLNTLVEQIKKGKLETNGMKDLDATVYLSQVAEYMGKGYIPFGTSSLCRMKFYEVDFGWGTPNQVTLADTIVNNAFVLSDTPKCDGIEALVSLDDHNMDVFLENEEVLSYTSTP